MFALQNISRVEENLNAILTNRVFNFIQVTFLQLIGISIECICNILTLIAMNPSFRMITFLAYICNLIILNLILVYIGNFIPTDGSVKGKEGVVYSKHGGFCLETQVYPDSVNQKSFPCDSVLRPGKIYDHRVTYKFLDF